MTCVCEGVTRQRSQEKIEMVRHGQLRKRYLENNSVIWLLVAFILLCRSPESLAHRPLAFVVHTSKTNFKGWRSWQGRQSLKFKGTSNGARVFRVFRPFDTGRIIDSCQIEMANRNEEDTIISEMSNPFSSDIKVTGVTLKIAFDTAWAVADLSEEKSERFTSPESLDLVHRLRRCSDCVLVGRTTVERDNCTLTVRRVPLLPENSEQPTRVVVDPNLHLLKSPSDHALLNDGLQTILYHSLQRQEEESFLPLGDTVSLVNIMMDDDHSTTTRTRYISMSPVIQDLQTRGIQHIMVEGGPVTALGFLADGLVDRAIIIQAPLTFKEPVASNISESVLTNAGLALMGSYVNDGGDTVQIWSRPNLPWPTDNLTNWP
eukprot:scaffold34398_cov51-Attheya_sp.AAC.7